MRRSTEATPLTTSNWLIGLVWLSAGVLVPLALVLKKLFGGSASGAKRSQ
jgi:hypothetical protein